MTAEGLTPGQDVEFQWATANGSFAIKTDPGAVKYEQRVFKPRRIPLGRATVDAQGKATATFAAPDDFGEVHEIYAVAGGQDVAQGGFRILRSATISPTEGPVGTPITITVTGMGWKPFEHSMGVLYDNKYGGYMSAVTPRGKAVFQLRAAGPPRPPPRPARPAHHPPAQRGQVRPLHQHPAIAVFIPPAVRLRVHGHGRQGASARQRGQD